jgi:hypothetical protein
MSSYTLGIILLILVIIGTGTVIKWIYKILKKFVNIIQNTNKTGKEHPDAERIKQQPRKFNQIDSGIRQKSKDYYNSEYYKQKHITPKEIKKDKGTTGEYAIYKELQNYENTGGRFIFNAYIEKDNNNTTELDVILIQSCGLIVFESKNYSGYIYGKEDESHWTEVLGKGKGRKTYKFYNPINQNKNHIAAIKKLVGPEVPVNNIVVFSDRCNLQGVKAKYSDIKIVNLRDVNKAVYEIMIKYHDSIGKDKIEELYELLYQKTQVSEEIKQQHIQNIKTKYY